MKRALEETSLTSSFLDQLDKKQAIGIAITALAGLTLSYIAIRS
jgi:hypothetical protein